MKNVIYGLIVTVIGICFGVLQIRSLRLLRKKLRILGFISGMRDFILVSVACIFLWTIGSCIKIISDLVIMVCGSFCFKRLSLYGVKIIVRI